MKKNIMPLIFLFILQLFLIPHSFSYDTAFPGYKGYVNDYANILSEETIYKLTRLSEEIEQKTTCQMAIVTVKSISPLDIETYAVKLFEHWGIGQKNKNNGILLLVAVDDRTVRIEVGYGLEGAIPDALTKNIIQNYIIPSFKAGDYNTGVLKGAASISKLIVKEYNVEISELDNIAMYVPVPVKNDLFSFLFLLFMFIIFIGFRLGPLWWLLFLPRPYRKDGFWHGSNFGGSSGGFSGGFGGFGGGFSGGGGASGRW